MEDLGIVGMILNGKKLDLKNIVIDRLFFYTKAGLNEKDRKSQPPMLTNC